MRRWLPRAGLLVAVFASTLIQAPAALAAFSDVPTSYWDYTAINYVAQQHTWMQDYGTSTFKPTTYEERRLLARTLVTMYAPTESIDPAITFSDLPTTDPFYPYANVATKLGWMPKVDGAQWKPTASPAKKVFDKAIISAMGQFSSAIAGLRAIKMGDRGTYTVNDYVPYMQLAHWLGLHYNHSDETLDIGPKTTMKRDEVAYSLWKATTLPSWEVADAAAFNDITLANLNPDLSKGKARQSLTAYALNQIGYPYVWGGEWNTASPTGYCCGAQPIGGMDCSGFVWWTIKKLEGGYNAAQYHPDYPGWSLPQRTSSDMASLAPSHIAWADLQVGDLMFFSSTGGTTAASVDHVGFNLGNNWMINSASGTDGVVLEPVADGWYFDHFVYGRRIVGASASVATLSRLFDPTAGEAGSGPRR
jgi:cell wall-associated NlpC family hydrolase